MINTTSIFILLGSALLLSWLAFKPCLNYARKHNIVDHPNKRNVVGQAGYNLVKQHYTWEAKLHDYDK